MEQNTHTQRAIESLQRRAKILLQFGDAVANSNYSSITITLHQITDTDLNSKTITDIELGCDFADAILVLIAGQIKQMENNVQILQKM